MSSVLVSILAFSVAITVLVAVHEYGHYWVARRAGIKVLRFSIGFGKPLWRRRFGSDDTEFVFSAIPLGGYVKMLDEREAPVAEHEKARSFNQASVPWRMAVLVAGPLANFIFAIIAYWVMFMAGVPGVKPVVGTVEPGSIAAEAGLRDGDRIVTFGDRDTPTWAAAMLVILDDILDDGVVSMQVESEAGSTGRRVDLRVAGKEEELTRPGELFSGLGFAPWRPQWPAVLEAVTAGGPAERGGLRPGDEIVSGDGEALADWPALVNFLRTRPGQEVSLGVNRDGTELDVMITVESVTEGDQVFGRVGIQGSAPPAYPDAMRAMQSYGPIGAIGAATAKTWEMSALTLRMLWKMLQGVVSPRNISGPINIAQYAGFSATIGVSAFVSFLAIVSISLGLINLMPVPMLDGGQLVYQAVELIKGKPVSEKTQIVGQQIGIFLLILLMTFAFYNDIARLLE